MHMLFFSSFKIMLTNVSHIFLRPSPPNAVLSVELQDKTMEVNVDFLHQQTSLCDFILDQFIQPMINSNALSTETS